jgi:hypothetical protein
LISVLREQDGPGGVFSVGFVSVLAGTLLAVEFIKDSLGLSEVLSGDRNRCTFQFFEVISPVNTPSFLPVDPKCPVCAAKGSKIKIWAQRFAELDPARK